MKVNDISRLSYILGRINGISEGLDGNMRRYVEDTGRLLELVIQDQIMDWRLEYEEKS